MDNQHDQDNDFSKTLKIDAFDELAGLADRMNKIPKMTVSKMTDYFKHKLDEKNIHIERAIAKSFAKSLLEDKDKTFYLDTETGGLGDDAEIIEISIIDGNGKTVFDTLIRPTKPVPEDAIAIHGITNEMLVDAPAWPDIVKSFERLFEKDGIKLAIYNADYDLRLLRQTYQAHDMSAAFVDDIEYISHCIMLAYADYYGEWDEKRDCYKWQKLTNAAQQCGINPTGAHRALADVHMTLGVVENMANGTSDK